MNIIGQEKIIKNLNVIIEVYAKTKQLPDNILLIGPAGMGKTTIANEFAKSIGFNFLSYIAKDIDEIVLMKLKEINENTIVFIDEIHTLPNKIEELLYPLLNHEKISYNIKYKENNETKIVERKIPAPPIVFIGATTDYYKLPKPLISRFGLIFKLEDYSDENIGQIILNKYNNLDIDIITDIIHRSRNNPRLALQLAKQIKTLLTANVTDYNEYLEYDKQGLTKTDILILKELAERGSTGAQSLASLINESLENYIKYFEPYLVKIKFITILKTGRTITEKGLNYLNQLNIAIKKEPVIPVIEKEPEKTIQNTPETNTEQPKKLEKKVPDGFPSPEEVEALGKKAADLPIANAGNVPTVDYPNISYSEYIKNPEIIEKIFRGGK